MFQRELKTQMGMLAVVEEPKEARTAKFAGVVTLDVLWEEAAKLGTISVDEDINFRGPNLQRVRIRFKHKNGSTIWAEHKDLDIKTAFAGAIAHAQEIKGEIE